MNLAEYIVGKAGKHVVENVKISFLNKKKNKTRTADLLHNTPQRIFSGPPDQST